MTDRRKQLLLITMTLVVLSLLVLAAGLSSVRFSAGDLRDLFSHPENRSTSPVPGTPSPTPDVFWLLLGALLIVLALIVTLASRLYRRRRKPEYEMVREEPRKGRWVVWVILLFFAFAVFAVFRWWLPQLQHLPELPTQPEHPMPSSTVPPATQPPVTPPASNPVPGVPNWIGLVLAGLTVAFLASGLAWLLWRWRAEQLERSGGRREIAGLAAQAVREIESGSEIQDVVLRAYRDMSRVLLERARLAAHRLRELTPREFEDELERAGVQSEYVGRLTRLFERVRYGEHLADDAERAEALACLRAVEGAYGETNHGTLMGTTA
jgi:hypothetical protein